MSKKVIYSGIQPSGSLTLGNYIGALSNFAQFQEEFDCLYCIVDMHAITVEQEPAKLRQNALQLLALYLAAGLDPKKSIVYIQSHVPEHAQLEWVLNTITYMGQLNRMTQFKDKSKNRGDNIPVGLFTYPVLMAADILLFQTDYVPVGEDQKQHLEFTRDIAERFNNRYSDTFVVPEVYLPKVGARIMSLQNPEAKMSKSDSDPNASIFLLDPPAVIKKKIKRAVTDSIGEMAYSDEQLGLRNLIDIYSAITGETTDEIVEKYKGQGYGQFKEDLGEFVANKLSPLQERYNEYLQNKELLEEIYRDGAQRASAIAQKTLRKVYKKVGFLPR
ncbi:MAG: tryptophan--tRNA ligase [Tissierellia bacterium]|nr:tryptophan--tRNA ligase [Tissierellia bacterium]